MSKTISVGIPTYKRPDALRRRLDELHAVFPDVDRVVISDNDPGSNLGAVVDGWGGQLIYHKNLANIGACANFVKLLDFADSDFLWFRGDDDKITEGVVDAVKGAVNGGAEIVIFTSLKCDGYVGVGLGDFCNSPYAIRASRWLSAVVVPVTKARQCLDFAYYGVASGWPHVTLILGVLQRFPSTKFRLISIPTSSDGFRDVGRDEGMKYAYFKTGIQYFPQTAQIIDDLNFRDKYLLNWRSAFDSKILRVAARMRLGFMAVERIGWATIWPLLDLRRPCLMLIALALWLIGVMPQWMLRIVISIIFCFIGESRRVALGFGFLGALRSPVRIYKLLKTHAGGLSACTIY